MARQETVLKVFVASPEDVSEERGCLEEIVRELNTIWAQQFGIRFELIHWETHTYPGFGEDPQAVINEQITQDFDIFIGLMWYRFGTPTGRAGSGTVEEFNRAKKRHDQNPDSLQLMIYFKDAPAPIPPSQLDFKQLARVSEFRSSLGEQGGLYRTFQTVSEFEKLVRMHLSLLVQKMTPEASALSPSMSNGKETLTPESVGQTEHDDDEAGLLDLLEQVDDEFAIVLEVTDRIADATDKYRGEDANPDC